MTIHMIWATSQDGYIGKNGVLGWYLPEDIKHFKDMTTGKTVVMGRKTWESIGSRPLPNRRNIILSKQYGYSYKFPGMETYVYDNIYSLMQSNRSFWVIGGSSLYFEFMPYADHIVKTEIGITLNGDVRTPKMFPPDWREVSNSGTLIAASGIPYRIEEYIRND